ncbi:MAG: hypothetical protein QOI21_5012 [Actinomycetota bacterium]|jgi:hypothetical protein|nr:hypothetical protein [Actinomycetota bacterium]
MITWTPIQTGDVPTYLGFLAAGLAAFFAWRSLSRQKKQYHDDLMLRREVDRRQHAQHVSAWIGGVIEDPVYEDRDTPITILNRSDEPVYNVVVNMVYIQGAAPQTGEELIGRDELHDHVNLIPVLPPGEWAIEGPGGWCGMNRAPGAEIAFTDRAGVHWVRRALGELTELDKPAPTYYKISLPAGFTHLHRAVN